MKKQKKFHEVMNKAVQKTWAQNRNVIFFQRKKLKTKKSSFHLQVHP